VSVLCASPVRVGVGCFYENKKKKKKKKIANTTGISDFFFGISASIRWY